MMEKVVAIKLSEVQSGPLLGNYESALGTITISRNNDKLYIQFNGDEKQEMVATSETELFLKGESMKFSFAKEPYQKLLTAKANQVGRIFKMTKVK